jgi:putative endonuclease
MTTPVHDRGMALTMVADYLQDAGFRLLDRDWQSAEGRLDVVATDRQVLVACEVRTRSGTRYGLPLETAGRARHRRLRKLAVAWMTAHGVRFDQVRVDIAGVIWEGTGGYTIEHTRGVV